MRYRVGRILRLVIVLGCLMLIIPYLMSKLDSPTSGSNARDGDFEYGDRVERPIRGTGGNSSLHPIMGDSLGNYELRDLPPRSGPGEGGL